MEKLSVIVVALCWVILGVACGSFVEPEPPALEPEPTTRELCKKNIHCNDGLFCNGVEICDHEDMNADLDGCVAGEPPCGDGSCDEGGEECEEECNPTLELCDGIDNDCDGVPDNGDPEGGGECFVPGEYGQCAVGTETCKNGDLVCEQTNYPGLERCDGIDNDCDGDVDEGNPDGGAYCKLNDLNGPCGGAEMQCHDGQLTCSQIVFPAAEVCDGVDNDCDGTEDKDELNTNGKDLCGCPTPGATQECGDTEGVCQAGIRVCQLDYTWEEACKGGVKPTDEICDGLDNNCDGDVDEDNPGGGNGCIVEGLEGPCASGIKTCEDGEIVCEQTVFPKVELCDLVDNDCDGNVDEENPGGGADCTLSGLEGECAKGVQECSFGKLECSQVVEPIEETCEQVDLDCDGENQNGLTCTCEPGHTEACGNDVGRCEEGTRTCLDTYVWGPCVGGVDSIPETCNNIDDNCSGSIDEGIQQVCYTYTSSTRKKGVCKDGYQICSEAVWQACVGQVGPSAEICDNKDNDCDGSTDESGVWPPNNGYEPNDSQYRALGQISPWYTVQKVSSRFGKSGDIDQFNWHMVNYDGHSKSRYWACKVTGLASGQTVKMWLRAKQGGYTGYWGYVPGSVNLKNNQEVTLPIAANGGGWGFGVGIRMVSGFNACENLSYTLECGLK